MKQNKLNTMIIMASSTMEVGHTHEQTVSESWGLKAKQGNAKLAAFDIVHANIKANDLWLTFSMKVSDKAGKSVPVPTGKLAGSEVFSYVWPTKINSADVGFEAEQGILSLAVTAHPDFDDTPLFDENADGEYSNDGGVWHSHWVVLVPDNACGEGALKVKDIAPGTVPKLPVTWPGLPILIDSPGYSPVIKNNEVEVRVPFKKVSEFKGVAFDGVTSGLRVNESAHAPLLCIVDVFDVASEDLSLPGKIQ